MQGNDTALMVWQVFKQLVRSLLQGKALSVEDIADALSMKDNDTTIDDYATALHLLARANVSKPVRHLIDLRKCDRMAETPGCKAANRIQVGLAADLHPRQVRKLLALL
jgi:hypothetical protein